MILDRHVNLKSKYWGKSLRNYYVAIVAKNKKIVKEYIENQLKKDYMSIGFIN